ncbi:MAG TPA: Wzz/FepE/Etk N-terminal domain-containing protein [Lentimicrobium sp.]|nr:Wzz/FepE/Etk N-terminal domain-containing protein [Lentimicrobium sp.]
MENYFNNLSLMKVFLKWKWHLLVIAVVAALLGAIFSSSFFITPKYKSYALVYPSNIAPYSDESESEQMLQWLLSKDIKDSIIKKYNLSEHYKIDTNYKYYYSTMMYLYNENVKINKTQWESIEIEVTDKDPMVAYNMVNSIMDYCNLKIRSIHKSKYIEVVESLDWTLKEKKRELDSVETALKELREKYGLFDYESQAEEITRGYLKTYDGSTSSRPSQDVMQMKANFEEKAGQLAVLSQRREDILRIYSEFELKYDMAVYDAEKQFTYLNIITRPTIADKKSYPVRWLIVLYSVAAAVFFSVVVISIKENRKIKTAIADLTKVE